MKLDLCAGLDGARDAIRFWERTDALREGVRLAGLTPHKQWYDAKMLLPLSEAEFVHVLGFLEERDLRSLGCTSLQGFTIQRREVNRRYGELGEGGPRFLSRRESAVGMVVTPNSERLRLNDGRILLSSYPRSGNSYLRGLLEGSTGIITGSDSRPNRNLSASLI